jgi:hypothetical protein
VTGWLSGRSLGATLATLRRVYKNDTEEQSCEGVLHKKPKENTTLYFKERSTRIARGGLNLEYYSNSQQEYGSESL